MKITVLTLFPEMFDALKLSMMGRAIAGGSLEFSAVNIRDFSADKHQKCDDIPYGGGAGMVMTAQPIISAFAAVDPDRTAHRVFLSPKGEKLCTKLAKQLATRQNLVLLCGHYEGVDQRAIDLCIDQEISIGDYVLTGGELPAMVLADCVCRFVPGVLGNDDSAGDESFSFLENEFEDGLLEYPHYTRPQVIEGLEVPEVLLSGHHANINKWRAQKAKELTQKLRPDLLNNNKNK